MSSPAVPSAITTATGRGSFGSASSPGAPELEVSALRRELLVEKHKNAHLEGELVKLRKSAVEISQQVEAEEECLINRMMKRLMALKKEKEDLALEVEQEEELLTNTLQKKLNELRQEKVDLEIQLEREQEYVVNKLRKQLAQVTADKERMAMEVEREEEFLTNKLVKKLDQISMDKAAVEDQLTQERIDACALRKEKQELENTLKDVGKDILEQLSGLLGGAQKRPELSGMEMWKLERVRSQVKNLVDVASKSKDHQLGT